MEQRKAVRFNLFAQVICQWQDPSGQNQESVGWTRDISTLGVFVVCPSTPPVGTTVSLKIRLPALERNRLQRLNLEAKGRVTRATDTNQGFAVTGHFELHENVL